MLPVSGFTSLIMKVKHLCTDDNFRYSTRLYRFPKDPATFP